MRLVFHLHFILTWFENVGDELKNRIFISISLTYKINIKLTDVNMNAQHKSSFYKFVRSEGEEGKKSKFGPPKFCFWTTVMEIRELKYLEIH